MQKINRFDTVGFFLQRAAKELSLHAAQVLNTKGFNLKIEHISILAILWEENNLTQQELGERISLDKTNITRAVDLLEESGFVKRVPGKDDRRNKYIQLTAKGKKMEQKIIPIVANEILGKACKGMKKEELAMLKKMLNTIYNNLKKAGE